MKVWMELPESLTDYSYIGRIPYVVLYFNNIIVGNGRYDF
jgi:hypothetical protein